MSFPTANLPPVDLVRLQASYRWRLISGALILVALLFPAGYHSAVAISTLRNIPVLWLPDSLPLKADFLEFVDSFRVTDVVMVSWPGCQLDSTSLQDVGNELAKLSKEGASGGDADEPDPRSDKFSPESIEFINRFRSICADPSPIDWIRTGSQLRDQLQAPPLRFSESAATRRLIGSMVGNDGMQSCVMISLGASTSDYHRTLLPMIRQRVASIANIDAEQVAMVGGPVDGAAVDGEAIRSIEKYSIPASLVAAVLCFICLRAFWLSATVLSVATIAQGMVLAMVYYIGFDMNAILIMLPPLAFVLTVSTGIHLANYFLDLVRESDMPSVEAARLAMQRGTGPCLMCTLTTILGLMSLLTVRLVPVQVFGIVASVGLIGSIALLLWMLPGAMILTRRKSVLPKNSLVESHRLPLVAPERWLKPTPIFVLFSVLAGVGGYGLCFLESTISVPRMFREDSELRTGYRWYEANVGATLSGDVLVQFANSTPATLDVLDELSIVTNIQKALGDVGGVGGTMSAVNFLPSTPKARDVRSAGVRGVIRRRIQDQENDIHQMGFFHDQDNTRTWRITLRLYQQDGKQLTSLLETIENTANQAAKNQSEQTGASVIAKTTGHVVIVQGTQELLLEDLMGSFLSAFFTIAILMALYLRSVIGGLLSMIPNVIPTTTLFGLMGWLSLPLDIGSVMTASLALGIAVDDSVHLISRYRYTRSFVSDRRSAAIVALRNCFWAMLQTTVVCGLSLLVYRLSDFIPTQRFAIFMLGLLTVAWLGVAILLPAMMATRLGDFFADRGSPRNLAKRETTT